MKIKNSKEHGNKGFVHNYVTTGKIKNYWTVGTRNGNPIARGAIHVDSTRFDTTNELSAKTIIHEASHKFASTADFGHKGYTRDETAAVLNANGSHLC